MDIVISLHAHQRLQQRGLSRGNVRACLDGGNAQIQSNGRRHYTRVIDNGMSVVHVITTAEADILVTAWISGRLDIGV